MAVRTKEEMRVIVNDMVDSAGTPRISAADARSVLHDLIDSSEFVGSPTGEVITVLMGLSADATPEASELTIEANNGVGAVDSYDGERYLLIARLATEADLSSVIFSDDDSVTNQVGAFEKFAQTVEVGGNAYNAWVSEEALEQPDDINVRVR